MKNKDCHCSTTYLVVFPPFILEFSYQIGIATSSCTYLLIVTTDQNIWKLLDDQNTCLIISILQFGILQMYHNIVFILHSLPYNAKPKQVLRQEVYVSMHYDLPFKASSLMVFWEKRAIGFSHEIKYLTSMQRGQIIGATMCLHISILTTYHIQSSKNEKLITQVTDYKIGIPWF